MPAREPDPDSVEAAAGRSQERLMAAAARERPTRHQMEALRAYIAVGSIGGAAHDLDIAESTARQHLSGLHERTGCVNAAQAAYQLGRVEARVPFNVLRRSARSGVSCDACDAPQRSRARVTMAAWSGVT